MITRRNVLLGSAVLPFAVPANAQAGSTLRIAMTLADIPVTDGAPDQGTEGIRFMGYTLYDPLVAWDLSSATEPAKLVPGLATKWYQDAADPTKWIFELRQGVQFHDGSPFTAIDYSARAIGAIPIPFTGNQSNFVKKYHADMMTVTMTGTSVNHGVAEYRSINGNAASVSGSATSHGSFTANQNWHAGGSQGGGRPTVNVPDVHASDYISYAGYKLTTVGGAGVVQTLVNGTWTTCTTAACKSTGWSYSGGNWSISGNSASSATYYVEGNATVSGVIDWMLRSWSH